MLSLGQPPVGLSRASTVYVFKVQLQFFERDCMMTTMQFTHPERSL